MNEQEIAPVDYLRNLANQVRPIGGLGIVVLVPDGESPRTRRVLIATHPAWQAAAQAWAPSHFARESAPQPHESTIGFVAITRETPGFHTWSQASTKGLVVVSHVLPAGRSIEVVVPVHRELHKPDVSEIARVVHSTWYGMKHCVFRPLSGITPQQGRVLELALEGLSAKESADQMGLTERTVNHHLTQLQQRLGTNGKTQSIVKAIWLGAL